MPKKKSKPKKRMRNDSKAAWNLPAGVEGSTLHDRQFHAPPNNGQPMIAENVGGRGRGQLTDAQRKKRGIGTGCDFGSWSVPNRRLNPRNKQDDKIIKKAYDSIHINDTNPSCARANIDKHKYDKNYKGIDWGKKKDDIDKNGARKPKKTRKVYK